MSESITDDEIARLRELATAATSGPWQHFEGTRGVYSTTQRNTIGASQAICTAHGPRCVVEPARANGAYIAAASPDVLLTLLDRLERAEKDAARYRWLRGNFVRVTVLPDALFWQCVANLGADNMSEGLDAAIDAAMRVGSGGSGK